MKCAKCGNALQAGERFCGECGTPVTVVTPPPIAVPPASAPNPVRQGVTPPPGARQPSPPPPVGDAIARLRALRNRRTRERLAPADATEGMSGQVSHPVLPPVPERVPDPAPVADSGRPRLVVDAGAVWGAYATIGEAIRAAVVPGTLITVKPGIYREALVIDRDVEIVGEGDRAHIVVEATDTDAVTVTVDRAVVRNLTVRAVGNGDAWGAVRVERGRGVIEGCDLTSAIGAVVYITGKDSAPVFRDCQIRDGSDRGVLVSDQGQGTIERCRIHGNELAGLAIRRGANPLVLDCEIRGGRDVGVVVHDEGLGTIERCRIHGHATTEVAIRTGGNPTVRDCEIRDGQSGGVYVYEQGKGTIEKCVISGNALAGVMIGTGGNPTVRDCVIRDGKQAGVYVDEQGQGTIEQSMISGNTLSGVVIRTGGNPVVRDCVIRDGKHSGVVVLMQGQGTFTGNTLTGNANGAWVIGADAGRVTRTGNRPNE